MLCRTSVKTSKWQQRTAVQEASPEAVRPCKQTPSPLEKVVVYLYILYLKDVQVLVLPPGTLVRGFKPVAVNKCTGLSKRLSLSDANKCV